MIQEYYRAMENRVDAWRTVCFFKSLMEFLHVEVVRRSQQDSEWRSISAYADDQTGRSLFCFSGSDRSSSRGEQNMMKDERMMMGTGDISSNQPRGFDNFSVSLYVR